ncbi:MAG: UDP-N-acetylglucosamine 2-epimerase (hydrolyzing) [Dehalococcoidales bacterium]|nr:UDP-N-acetylglucosamine 2-epimerase (hydrolyzing) [Dehalococcoidales bacterium]
MRTIGVVTGTRSEYGILLPVIKAIMNHDGLQLKLVVAGMHLSPEFGFTVSEIEKDSIRIDARVEMLPQDDTLGSMVQAIGRGIQGMGKTWGSLIPDLILVLGDRIEPLAATIAGSYMNIPVAHIHGGDTSRGGLDEYARHAITQFSHIHFPATEKSAERIIKMGIDSWRVHMVGSPSLDDILNKELPSREILTKKYQIDTSHPLILLVQHPVTTQVDDAQEQIRITLEAVLETGYPSIIIYPNADAGGRHIIDILEQYVHCENLKMFKSIPREDYLGILGIASVLVGNSSSGMIEAPSFALPVINIGIRQEGRERGQNVIDVPHDKDLIVEAIERALKDPDFLTLVKKRINPYGDGKAGIRIAEILANVELTPGLLQRKMAY